jgi:hypothetical protein
MESLEVLLDLEKVEELTNSGQNYHRGSSEVRPYKLESEDEKFLVYLTDGHYYYKGIMNKYLERSGLGRNIYKNEDIYLGEFNKKNKEGNGIYLHNNKIKDFIEIYSGQWKNGKKEGVGIYVWSDQLRELRSAKSCHAFVGIMKDDHYFDGLYFIQEIEEGQTKRYVYKGKFNTRGHKTDDEAFYYQINTKTLFFGKFEEDEINSGFYFANTNKTPDKDGIIQFDSIFKSDPSEEDLLPFDGVEAEKILQRGKDFIINYHKSDKFQIIFDFIGKEQAIILPDLDLDSLFLQGEEHVTKFKSSLNSFMDIYEQIIKSFD